MQTDSQTIQNENVVCLCGNQNPKQYVASCISCANFNVVHWLFPKHTPNESSPFAFYCNLFRYYWLFRLFFMCVNFLAVVMRGKHGAMLRIHVANIMLSVWPLFLFSNNATQKKEGDSTFNTGYQVLLVFHIRRCLPITALFSSHCCLLESRCAFFFSTAASDFISKLIFEASKNEAH